MKPVLSLRNVSFSYDGSRMILNKISLEMYRGEVLCILGANGCGKSTLMRTVAGANRGFSGDIRVDEEPAQNLGPNRLAKRIAIVFQEHNAPFPFTVQDVVQMGRAPHLPPLGTLSAEDRRIVDESMEAVGVGRLRAKTYTQISGGERQLVLIARALAQKTDVILLDEPTSHLDFRNQALVLKTVHSLAGEQGLAVAMTTHLPDQALLYRSKVALMHEGKILCYGPGEEVLTDENLKVVYGMGVRVLSIEEPEKNRSHRVCIPLPETL